MKILPIFQRKGTKSYALWFSGLQQYAFGGLKHVGTGKKVQANRERDGWIEKTDSKHWHKVKIEN